MVPLASMYLPGTCEKTSFGVKVSAVIVSPYVYILMSAIFTVLSSVYC